MANNFLLSNGLIKGGAGVLPELAHVLCHCSHTPNGLCTVLEQAGSKECIDWLGSYLQPHLLWSAYITYLCYPAPPIGVCFQRLCCS